MRLPYLPLCTSNEDDFLRGDDRGVCVYCTHTVLSRDIGNWADDRDGRTVICPVCSVDAVVHVRHMPMSRHLRYQKIVEWHNIGFGHWQLRYDAERCAVVEKGTGCVHHQLSENETHSS